MSKFQNGAPVMRRFLTEPEQGALLKAAKASSDPLAQRDYWWMRLMMATGIRVEEFSLLDADQAEAALYTGWLVVGAEKRKGRKQGHEYSVTQTVRECLQALLAIQAQHTPPLPDGLARHDAGGPLVWGRDGQRLSVRSYQARMKLWVQAAGLPADASCHWLRHTRGMNILRRSRSRNPLKVVQCALGHANLNSTGIYTAMARDELARDLAAVDGRRMTRRAARAMATGRRDQPAQVAA